jgi:disulfide bond formation protein DsbB
MNEILTPTKVLIAALAFSAASLAFAFSAQEFWDIQPCALCHYQRYMHMFVIAICALVLGARKPSFNIKAIFLVGIAYLGTAGLAIYQVLVEKKVLELPQVCKLGPLNYNDFSQFKKALMGHKHVPCDEIQWSLFGISMAGYSAITALMAGLACFVVGMMLVGDKRARHGS